MLCQPALKSAVHTIFADGALDAKPLFVHGTQPRPGTQVDYYDVPHGEMLFEGKRENKEDVGSLMDTTINNAVIEYGFPVEFFLDTLCRRVSCIHLG